MIQFGVSNYPAVISTVIVTIEILPDCDQVVISPSSIQTYPIFYTPTVH